mmetsp:Transcript_61573/g.188098  ORF Transcript_61573/g.188098 Transcript_61573/m.188098 type:complete len:219 (-) Transcript_61573:169-825(-)
MPRATTPYTAHRTCCAHATFLQRLAAPARLTTNPSSRSRWRRRTSGHAAKRADRTAARAYACSTSTGRSRGSRVQWTLASGIECWTSSTRGTAVAKPRCRLCRRRASMRRFAMPAFWASLRLARAVARIPLGMRICWTMSCEAARTTASCGSTRRPGHGLTAPPCSRHTCSTKATASSRRRSSSCGSGTAATELASSPARCTFSATARRTSHPSARRA